MTMLRELEDGCAEEQSGDTATHALRAPRKTSRRLPARLRARPRKSVCSIHATRERPAAEVTLRRGRTSAHPPAKAAALDDRRQPGQLAQKCVRTLREFGTPIAVDLSCPRPGTARGRRLARPLRRASRVVEMRPMAAGAEVRTVEGTWSRYLDVSAPLAGSLRPRRKHSSSPESRAVLLITLIG
jgi:hypothetical protein